MALKEIFPPEKGAKVTLSTSKTGSLNIGIGAVVARRLGITGKSRLRVLINSAEIDGRVTGVVVMVDAKGPWSARIARGESAVLVVQGVAVPKIEKTVAQFQETADRLEIVIPASARAADVTARSALSAPSKPLQQLSMADERNEARAKANGNGRPRYFHRSANDVDDPIAAAKL